MKNLLLLLVLAVMFSCQTKPNKEELKEIKDTEEFDETSKVLAERFASIYQTVPTSELSAYLASVDATYNGSFINDPGKAAEYLGSHEKSALAMGAYYMDLIYVSAYQKTDQVGTLYDAISMLSDSVGMGRAFNQSIQDKFQEELESNPEAQKYVSDALVTASKHLNTSDRTRLSTLVMTGVVIERLHLVSSIIQQSASTEDMDQQDIDLLITPLMKVVADQRDNVKTMVEAVNLIRTPEDDGTAFTLLYELQHEYDRLEEAKKDIDPTVTVSHEVLTPIFEVVADLRATIVDSSN